MSAYLGRTCCPRCGAEYGEDGAYTLCASCDSDGVHVFPAPVYDLARVEMPLGEADEPGLFRFRALLPVSGEAQSLGEGDTPLIRLGRGADAVGLSQLWVKDESRNPTWSYKDRLAAVAVTVAAEQGADTVVVSSTGNHGAAIAAYAARAGLRCVVMTLASVPLAMKVLMQSYGAQVVAFEQPIDRWTVMEAGIRERGWIPMSGWVSPPSGSNPFGIEGYKTIAYELVEQLAGAPDAIVAPVAYGDGITGLVRGFEDLRALGLIETVPRIIAAEPHGPIAAVLAGTDVEVPSEPSVAFSIAALTPSWQGVEAVRRTGGGAATATNAQIMAAQAMLARSEGYFPEPSSAITYAVLPDLLQRGLLSAEERVVLLGTSTGLKDVETTAALGRPVPISEPTLAAFDRAVDATMAHL
jgi:threonine synthase